jgi:hypothetical protein
MVSISRWRRRLLTGRRNSVKFRLDTVAFGIMSSQIEDGEWGKKINNLATSRLVLVVAMATTE